MTTATATETNRNANVSDKVVIAAWQSVATSGKSDACIEKAATVAGMKKASFQQRISKIRKALEDARDAQLEAHEVAVREAEAEGLETPEVPVMFELAEMPRASGGGRKKEAKDFLSILANVNSELGIDSDTDETDDESDSDSDES